MQVLTFKPGTVVSVYADADGYTKVMIDEGEQGEPEPVKPTEDEPEPVKPTAQEEAWEQGTEEPPKSGSPERFFDEEDGGNKPADESVVVNKEVEPDEEDESNK